MVIYNNMYFKDWILEEMPIGAFEKLGQWDAESPKRTYDKKSIGILSSEKGIAKIKRQWSKTESTFDMYFARSKGQMKSDMKGRGGEVDQEWIDTNLDVKIEANPDNISVIYLGNVGSPKEPMTGWILAHRFGHAIAQTSEWQHLVNELHQYLSQIAKDVYDKKVYWNSNRGYGGRSNQYPTVRYEDEDILNILAQNMGTFKSARNGKVANLGEFSYELLSQYIITGKIKFKKELPHSLSTRGPWGRLQFHGNATATKNAKADMEHYINNTVTETLEYYFDSMLSSFHGRVFVI